MPHLSPILWFLIVIIFLVILRVIISSFWWIQLNKFSVESLKRDVKKNLWAW